MGIRFNGGNMNQGRRLAGGLPLASVLLSLLSTLTTAYADSANSPFAGLNVLPSLGKSKWANLTAAEELRAAYAQIESVGRIGTLLRSGATALAPLQRIDGEAISTLKFQSYYKGLEVLGAQALHHATANGSQVSDFLATFDLSTAPSVSLEQAVAIARGLHSDRELLEAPELKILPSIESDSARLIWWVKLAPNARMQGQEVVIDAHKGEVIADVTEHIEFVDESMFVDASKAKARPKAKPAPKKTLTLAPIQVYQAIDSCEDVDFEGRPMDIRAQECTQTVKDSKIDEAADADAREAAANSLKTLEYYRDHHNRNSLDGAGLPIVAVVHAGEKFNNAFWSSQMKIMGYGDGDGVIFRSFTGALDVAGHEMTHGVVSQTAKLLGFDQSGALNEAYADFFGKMVAKDGDWRMGPTLFLDQTNAKGVRDLANPGNLTAKYKDATGTVVTKPFPKHMSEAFPVLGPCDSKNNKCWVHVNSTIPGHASYLVIQAIGAEKAEKLYYATLTQFLTATSTFKVAAEATKKACAGLFDAATCTKVKESFAAVGL